MVEVGKTYTLIITGMTHDGCGIGDIDGLKVFIDGVLPGETVEAEIVRIDETYAAARLKQLINPLANRIKPFCIHFIKCGGCSLQFISYEEQLKIKTRMIKDTLYKIAKINGDIVNDTLGMSIPLEYRNKTSYPAGIDSDKPVIGFYQTRTNKVSDIEQCDIQHKVSNLVKNLVKQYIERFDIKVYDKCAAQGIIRHVVTRTSFKTGEVMVIIVINGRELPKADKLISLLTSSIPRLKSIVLNVNMDNTSSILGTENILLYGDWTISDYIGDLRFDISPLSFFQVNPVQTKILYDTILDFASLTGNETVLDLYCGTGTIALYLARGAARVVGIEVLEDAVADARKNAVNNGISNAEFYAGRVENVIEEVLRDCRKVDVVILDPPRKGCKKTVLDIVARIQPQKLIYVSCNPSTMADDVKYLAERGMRVSSVQPVDMFPHTGHVETVAVLYKT